MNLLNLTPHAITVYRNTDDGVIDRVTIFPAGVAARVEETFKNVHELNGIPVLMRVSAIVVGLPEKAHGRYIIVSRMVAVAAPERDDLLFPDDIVRDSGGRVVGCRAWGAITHKARPMTGRPTGAHGWTEDPKP